MIAISNQNKLILLLLAGLSIFTFYLRILPALSLGDASPLAMYSSDDPYYNLRLVELYVQTGKYQWFDPLTYFPYGLWLNWGPLFTVVCATVCNLFGATTTAQIAYVSSFVPAVMATACVPVAFLLGKELRDWKTGVITAIMMAFIGGQFFHRSVAGYLDHHTAEVLFALLFVLMYVWSIKHRKEWIVSDGKDLLPGFPVIATTASFMLLVYTMPTSILFAFITFIFTCIWMVHSKDRDLVSLNCLAFGTSMIIYILTIPWTVALNLDTYSIVPPIAYGIIALVGFLFVFKNGRFAIPAFGIGIVFIFLFSEIRNLVVGSIFQFFGQTIYTSTVQEARAWTFNDAMLTFGIAVPLTLFGIFVLVYSVIKDKKPELLFVATWAIFVSIATIQHVRYEYYFAPVAAICSAYVLSAGVDLIKPKPIEIETRQQKRKQKQQQDPAKRDRIVRTLLSIMTAGLLIYFCAVSGVTNYMFAANVKMGANPEWVEPLVWMKTNTPDTGMDFNTVYDHKPVTVPQPKYEYPSSVYGVMSWWDYGHIIEYYAHRPPNANPFQAGVIGTYGAARFFIADTEEETTKIADELGTKYVITDIEMSTYKFWAMATWANVDPTEYQDALLDPGTKKYVQVLKSPFYQTTIVKMHILDGSYKAGPLLYVEYDNNHNVKFSQAFNTTQEAEVFVGTRIALEGKAFLGYNIVTPAGEVPALKHFRLIHESPTDINSGMRYVKVFEYVKGATVSGDGLIYTEITTNTGRTFVYTQKSENGVWILPYSGTYKKQDGTTITVTEDDIR